MKRYLKSMALLALIAALLMGCNTIPDTPEVPDIPEDAGTDTSADTGTDTTENTDTDIDIPAEDRFSVAYECPVIPYVTDLSGITKLNYDLHKADFDLLSDMSFQDRLYPLNNGCWAYGYRFFSVKTTNSKQLTTPIVQAVTILYPDGAIPHWYPRWAEDTTFSARPISLTFTLALAFDNGDLLSCHNLSCEFRNHVTSNFRGTLSFGEMIRDNRFSRIAAYQSKMSAYYSPNEFSRKETIIPAYALFDRFTRLTDYKYCELYASGDVFVGLYYDKNFIVHTDIIDETGEILRSEATSLRAKYPEEKNDYGYDGLTVMQDSKTGLYYYANAKGEAVCEPTFTECTNIKNGTAVVKIGSVLYMLVVTSAE